MIARGGRGSPSAGPYVRVLFVARCRCCGVAECAFVFVFLGARLCFADALGVQLLENLVVAMESEAQVIDISRVSGFMQKVRPAVMVLLCEILNAHMQVRNGVI